MNDRRRVTLGDLIEVKHGYAFKSQYFAAEGDELVLKPGNFPIGGGLRLRPGKDHYYTGSYPSEFRLSPSDLLVVMTDLTQDAAILGSPAFVPESPPVLHNQRLGLVTIKPDVEVDRRFLYYLLLSDTTRIQLRATATGTTVRHTAPERIYRVSVDLPPLPVQQIIGDVLGSLDDLRENNRRRIEILDETAHATYREWFVNHRFPGYEKAVFVPSPVGDIPEGWTVVPASEALQVNPRIEAGRALEHPFLSMGDLDERSMVCLSSETKATKSGSKFQNGDTLFARITPCLENGKTGLVQCLEPGQVGRGSTEFIVLRGRMVGSAFTYCLARSEDFRANAARSMSGASGRQRVRNECFDSYYLSVPPASLVDNFEEAMSPIFDSVYSLALQSAKLLSIRDLLLPRLITGLTDISMLVPGPLVEEDVA